MQEGVESECIEYSSISKRNVFVINHDHVFQIV